MGKKSRSSKGGNLGFELDLLNAADKIRGNMEPSDYKHVILSRRSPKHISDCFMLKCAELEKEYPGGEEAVQALETEWADIPSSIEHATWKSALNLASIRSLDREA